jgi:hypothetical protein
VKVRGNLGVFMWGHVVGKSSVLAFFVAAISMVPIFDATAGACRGRDRDNPMVASEGFGVATCATRGPRYHSRDFRGESARGYMRRNVSDPMVWSDAQWRSTLMSGYARDDDSRYDRRFRRAAPGGTRVVRSVARVIITNDTSATLAEAQVAPRRSMAMRVRDGETDVMENRSGFAGHKCSGILVLRWGAAGSRARCHNDKGRVRTLR